MILALSHRKYFLGPGIDLCKKSTDVQSKKRKSEPPRVKTLGEEWISLLISNWKFSDQSTEKMMRKLFKLQRVFGVFVDGCKEPISWIVLYR